MSNCRCDLDLSFTLFEFMHFSQTPRKEAKIDPLADYPDVIGQPMIGPSIIFDGIPAYWNGSSTNNKVC